MNRRSLAVLLLFCPSLMGATTRSTREVISLALAKSPELRSLEANVAAAQASSVISDAFRSSASVSATPGYATGIPTAVAGQIPAIGTIEVHRLLYDPAIRAEQIVSMAQIGDATSRLESRRQEIAQSVMELVARIEGDDVFVDSARQRLAALESIGGRTEALAKEGRARALDVARASLKTRSAQQALAQAETRRELDRLRLEQMVGEHVDTVKTELDSVTPSEVLKRAIANDPQLRNLSARIEASQAAARLTGRILRPSVAVQAQYSRLYDRFRSYYLHFQPDDFSLGAAITLPLWTGGRNEAISARFNAQVREFASARDGRLMELELSVRESELEFQGALAESGLASRARDVALEGLHLAQELEREGRGEGNEWTLARISVADAEDELARARIHVVSSRARLLALAGELVPPR